MHLFTPPFVRSRDACEPESLFEQALTRAAGAPLVLGNSVRLLRDAAENYPAWLHAIASARRTVHLESYIIHDDEVGAQFAEALALKARDGVRVRVIYDWIGGMGTRPSFWRRLRRSGVEVRCFRPPRFSNPFGWLSRDHRKTLTVDGQVGFITGLCIGRQWVGDPMRGGEPWRDTGMEVHGPAVADIDAAFAHVWASMGSPIPAHQRADRESLPRSGNVSMRVVANTPMTAGLLRVDQLIACAARETLWLTDAYFAGIPLYVEALRSAVRDGVDVRLLVPGATDIPLLRPITQAGFAPLLSGGIRVFEWNGSMLHAKTAVADLRWARVGSTNLNLASWLGNYELDGIVEDATFAESMHRMYLDDLAHATEIVLGTPRTATRTGHAAGSASRVTAGAIRMGNALGAGMTGRRVLGRAERTLLLIAGGLSLALALVVWRWPIVAWLPLTVLLVWIGLALLLNAVVRERKIV
jgi:cardiolipin synthase